MKNMKLDVDPTPWQVLRDHSAEKWKTPEDAIFQASAELFPKIIALATCPKLHQRS